MNEIFRLSDQISDDMTEPPWASIVGRKAIFTTYEGESRIGVVEAPTRLSSGYPIIRFPDGTWGRCDDAIELLP